MNYRDFEVEDFIVDERFIKWVKSSDPKSDRFWKNWMGKNPDRIAILNDARDFVESLSATSTQLTPATQQEMLSNIHRAIKPVSIRKIWFRRIAAAAVLAGLLWAGILMMDGDGRPYETAFGETEEMTLPDGSAVVLNANSRLWTDAVWEEGTPREVWLQGEAFFRVQAAELAGGRRFVVYAGDLEVIVVGTEFNVNNYGEWTRITLTEGQIKLWDERRFTDTLTMRPGEQVEYHRGLGTTRRTSNVNTAVYTSWQTDKLHLEQTPMTYLVEVIENTFGYDVVVKDPEALTKKLSGKIPKNDVEVLIRGIETVAEIPVRRSAERVIVIGE